MRAAGYDALTSATTSRTIAPRSVSCRTTGMLSPMRLIASSSKSATRCVMRCSAFAIAWTSFAWSGVRAPDSSRKLLDIAIAPSGLRRSWPSTARNCCRVSSISFEYRTNDSAIASSIASSNRISSSSSVAPASFTCAVHKWMTLARSARNSATICTTAKPLSARPYPWRAAGAVERTPAASTIL